MYFRCVLWLPLPPPLSRYTAHTSTIFIQDFVCDMELELEQKSSKNTAHSRSMWDTRQLRARERDGEIDGKTKQKLCVFIHPHEHAIVLWKYDGQSVIQYNRIACCVNVCRCAWCWIWYEMPNGRMNDWLMCERNVPRWCHTICASNKQKTATMNPKKSQMRFYFMMWHS